METQEQSPPATGTGQETTGAIRPSVGRIVHYNRSYNDEPNAALITGLNSDGTVALRVFDVNSSWAEPSVPYNAGRQENTWSWPERQAATA